MNSVTIDLYRKILIALGTFKPLKFVDDENGSVHVLNIKASRTSRAEGKGPALLGLVVM